MNKITTTPALTRRRRWLRLWTSWPWSACLSGLAGAALSGSLVLATPPRTFPPAFSPTAPAPAVVAPKPAEPATTQAWEGPDLFPSEAPSVPATVASPIQTTVPREPQLIRTSAPAPAPVPRGAQPNRVEAHGPAMPGIAPTFLTRDEAIRWALQYNPEIEAIRQQHGIAEAGVVIAKTYPFNPTLDTRIRGTDGPISAGITNRVDLETNLLLEIEIRGQKQFRSEGALAGLSRTDNEIAFQELCLAVRTGRAFDTLLYRLQKATLAEEAVKLTQEAVEQVRRLKDAGKLKPADLIIIQTELSDFIAQANMARATVVPARTEVQRALGVVDRLEITDTLETPPLHLHAKTLVQLALDRRPDRQAREAAVDEAEARVKLETANRYGNPLVGASYGYDPTRVNSVGGIVSLPIPILNQHNGDILQREAERDRAFLELHDAEVQVVHDVEGAVSRLEAARAWADEYHTKIIPELKTSLESLEKLFLAGDASVDVLRLLDVRRKVLRARDGYLDAQWELRQAQADLAAALGDPSLLAPSLRTLCQPPAH